MDSVEILALRAKYLDFRCTVLGKGKFRLTKDGIVGGGYQGKITECLAYLDGWDSYKLWLEGSKNLSIMGKR
jgi:hypothetical protein